MSNEQLLLTLVEDATTAAELARSLVHQVQVKGCVLKPEAMPTLALCREKLGAAHNAALELERRAKSGDPRGVANLLCTAGSALADRHGRGSATGE